METMVSLRLTPEQEQRIRALAADTGLTRSEWLRRLIEREIGRVDRAIDAHQRYAALMQGLEGSGGRGRKRARGHSEWLKSRLHAQRRR
jgi:predicted DNA-binding protein